MKFTDAAYIYKCKKLDKKKLSVLITGEVYLGNIPHPLYQTTIYLPHVSS